MFLSFAVGPFEHEAMPSKLITTRGMILLKIFRGLIFVWLSVEADQQAADKLARRGSPRVLRTRSGNRLDVVVPSLRDRAGCVVRWSNREMTPCPTRS